MTETTLSIILIVSVGLLIASMAFVFASRIKKARYNEKTNKAVLEGFRNSMEKQIYALNDRLIQNEERWKDVNHLLYREHYSINKSPISNSKITFHSDFLRANGITENDLVINPSLIFVLTPFNGKFSNDYAVIKDACTSVGFICVRGDENHFKGDIFPEMLKLIVKANLVIANINGRNPNVLYELGIAHAIDKPVLLVSREPENLPIEVRSKRFLTYSSENQLKDLIRQELLNLSMS